MRVADTTRLLQEVSKAAACLHCVPIRALGRRQARVALVAIGPSNPRGAAARATTAAAPVELVRADNATPCLWADIEIPIPPTPARLVGAKL